MAIIIEEAMSNAGVAAVFLTGIAGYVSLVHVTEPKDEQRPYVEVVEDPKTKTQCPATGN